MLIFLMIEAINKKRGETWTIGGLIDANSSDEAIEKAKQRLTEDGLSGIVVFFSESLTNLASGRYQIGWTQATGEDKRRPMDSPDWMAFAQNKTTPQARSFRETPNSRLDGIGLEDRIRAGFANKPPKIVYDIVLL